MKLTYYGHACFAVETGGKHLLFDPFITPNELAKSVDVDAIAADYIFLSHGHFDHVTDAARIAMRTGATVIAGFEVSQWIGNQGVKSVEVLNPGGGRAFDFGRVKMVNAIHSSSLPDGSYGGQPAGFVVESREGAFHYSGDTALTLDMKLIADDFELRFAVMPVGDRFTMGAVDAAKAAGFVGCDDVVGVHFDTWPPIEIDREAAKSAFAKAGRRLHLLEIGASIDF
jgi:L-ascorbate metabolism protein UlaG (beta-lactamase superfamily)